MDSLASSSGTLKGLVVLDLTRALSGPFAGFILAGLGATVIKIEQPGVGALERHNPPYVGKSRVGLAREEADDCSFSFLNTGRGKRSVTLDPRSDEGRAVFADLVRRADVVLENYSAGTAARMGIDYSFCQGVNPAIVYCALSGFGAEDRSSRKAMDMVAQAASGVTMLSGDEDDPPVPCGLPLGDLVAPLWSVIGILAALRDRDRTGLGQFVDVSMVGGLASLIAAEPTDLLNQLGIKTRNGRSIRRLTPFGIFRARDGDIAICASRDEWVRALFAAMGQPELASDPRFASRSARVAHGAELDAMIDRWTQTLTVDEIEARLAPSGMPLQKVLGPYEAIADDARIAHGDTVLLRKQVDNLEGSVVGSGIPIRFSRTPRALDTDVRGLGTDNVTVFSTILGYPPSHLAALRERGVI